MTSTQCSLIILETNRLILRRIQPSDVMPLVDLWSDPEVTRFLGGPRDKAWLKSEFSNSAQDPFAERYDLWPVIEKETGRVIGHCGLLDKEVEGKTEIELNYIISPPMWGKGIGTEMADAIKRFAFMELGLIRLIALIEPNNEASGRVAIKIGMHFEKEISRPGGFLRKEYIVEAKYRVSAVSGAAAGDLSVE
jgi:[ribosomal protein S5]-alanine N-acetyltransferase